MSDAAIEIERSGEATVVRPAGPLVLAGLTAAERRLGEVPGAGGPVVIDLGRTETLDTAGAWLLVRLKRRLEAEGATVEIRNADSHKQALLDTVERSTAAEEAVPEPPRGLIPWIEAVGRGVAAGGGTSVELLAFVGIVIARIGSTLLRPWRLRLTSLVHQAQESGLKAVPIVAMMSFLIGIVMAYQGTAQLEQFGAQIYVVDLVSISVLRELGVLLTAILVAGRSGSAFTATIGMMKVREEIDAMQTLGLDWAEVLVLPRVLALFVMLPILAFIADLAGLVGGGLMVWFELGITPARFIAWLWEYTDVWNFLVGMIKAPVFAFIIAVVACFMGMRVGGSAESVGRLTTASVVTSIFIVIVVDALFSIFFAEIGV